MQERFLPLILFLMTACSQFPNTTTVGVLTLPAAPHTGERMSLQYNIGSSKIADEEDLQAILYYTVKEKIYAEPVALSDTGNPMKFSITIPDSAQAFALKFQAQHSVVNEKNRYVFPVYDHAGKRVAGALSGMSLFYNDVGSSILDRDSDKDTVLKLMRADFGAHPEIKRDWMDLYLNTLLTTRQASGYKEIQTALQQMLSSESIKQGDYFTSYNLYIQMGMWDKADSMMTIGSQKFPNGSMAMQTALSRFYSLRSVAIDSLITHYQKFKHRFPATDMQSTAARIQDRMLGTIAVQYSDSGDYQKFLTFISQIKDPLRKARAYNYLSTELTKVNKNLPLEKFVVDGKTTDKLDAYLKQAYVSLNHSEEG